MDGNDLPGYQTRIPSTPFFVDLGHCELAYRQVGQGEPLLLVHGYPVHGMTFRHLAPFLAPHYTCIIPDLPGLGETKWTAQTDFNFAGQAKTLRDFIDRLGLKSYSIIAQDTGATIARKLALTDLSRVKKLAMINTEIPDHRPPWIETFQKIANPKQTAVFKFLMSSRTFRHSSAGFGGLFYDASLIDGEFRDLFVKFITQSPKRIEGQTRYLMGIDWKIVDGMRQEHARLIMPTLLIWGKEDTVFPLEDAREMASQLPNCKGIAVIEKARLLVHEERPADVARAALDFLRAA